MINRLLLNATGGLATALFSPFSLNTKSPFLNMRVAAPPVNGKHQIRLIVRVSAQMRDGTNEDATGGAGILSGVMRT